MGVPYRERGARMNEAIELLKALWAVDHVSYEGRYYRVRDLTIDPKPVQRPHPPIWIGGGSQPFEKVYGQSVTNRSEEHTSELQSRLHLVCRLLLEKKKKQQQKHQCHNTV